MLVKVGLLGQVFCSVFIDPTLIIKLVFSKPLKDPEVKSR